jgi:pimeloyl-ACP methyl ester carboxylesterase
MSSPSPYPGVVLVHGAYADGSCWSAVIQRLQGAGLAVTAARAPDAGEDYAAVAARFPAPPASAGLVYSAGYGALTEHAFLNDFANGVDPAQARVLYAVQGRVSEALFHQETAAAAWRSKPSWYAVSRQDRTISPDLQRFFAQRMRATTIEIDAGHLSLITHPDEVTQLILDAAQAVRA